MKTLYTTLILLIFTATSVVAQKLDKEKIDALKVAFITERLDLTASEAEKFWPIYNDYQKKDREIKEKSSAIRKKSTPSNHKNITEKEAKENLLKVLEYEDSRNNLSKKYITDLLEVIPAKKVILAMSGDREFRHKMIKEYKERHEKLKEK